eukprot:6215224-Prymnesium_polylepis.2
MLVYSTALELSISKKASCDMTVDTWIGWTSDRWPMPMCDDDRTPLAAQRAPAGDKHKGGSRKLDLPRRHPWLERAPDGAGRELC